ncbi:MAG: uroporphyrinogen-III synthase [Alphaproteobacteria bacterium]
MPASDPIGEGPLTARPLAGRRIAILEHREQDRLGGMLEAQGALTVRCPLVAIADAPDPAPVLAWLKRFIEAPPDDLVLMTGEGLRRLQGFAERAGMAPEFRGALARVRTVTRGPKPARALREIGLTPGLRADPATSAGVAAALGSEEILQLIAEIEAGRIDVVAFTSAAQILQLIALARAADVEKRLRDGLGRTRIAAVGPVVSAELERLGLPVAIMPPGSFFMKPLVTAIIAALPGRSDEPDGATIR